MAVAKGGYDFNKVLLADFLSEAAGMTVQEYVSTLRDLHAQTGQPLPVMPVVTRSSGYGMTAPPTGVVQVNLLDTNGGTHPARGDDAGATYTTPSPINCAIAMASGAGAAPGNVVIAAPPAGKKILLLSILWTIAAGATPIPAGAVTAASGGIGINLAIACPANDSRSFFVEGPLPATLATAVTLNLIGGIAGGASGVIASYAVVG